MSTISLASFIGSHSLSMTVSRVDRNPTMQADAPWHAMASHYKCVISRKGGSRLTVYFSQGPAIRHDPRIADVLDCLASDAASYYNAGTFESWCDDLGYDHDSRRAMSTYQACKSIYARLLRVLGRDAFQVLLYDTERL